MTCPPERDCRGGLSLAHVRPRGRIRFDMTQPCSCRFRRRRLIPAEPKFRTVEPRPEKIRGHARGQRCRGVLPAPLRSQAERPGLGQFICLVPFSITEEVWQNAACSAVLRVHVLSPDSSRTPYWLRICVSPTQPSPCAVSPMSRCLIRGTVAAFRRTSRTDGMMYRLGP